MMPRISRVLGAALAVGLVLGVFLLPQGAAADEDEWSRLSYPHEDKEGDWFRHAGLGEVLGPVDIDRDGYLWAYAWFDDDGDGDQGEGECRLFRSLDGYGRGWRETGFAAAVAAGGWWGPETSVAAVVCSQVDADTVYVAATDSSEAVHNAVYRTEDGGENWRQVGSFPYEDTGAITSLAVGYDHDYDPHLFVGTLDEAPHRPDEDVSYDTGGIFYCYDIPFGKNWTTLSLDIQGETDDLNVYSVSVSPRFRHDHFQAAVAADIAADTSAVCVHTGANPVGWDSITLDSDADVDYEITGASDPVFPSGFDGDDFYQGDGEFFVGVGGPAHTNTEVGGVYGVYGPDDGSARLLTGVRANIGSLDGVGRGDELCLLAGETDAADVWYTWDGAKRWKRASAEGVNPAGDGPTHVVMNQHFKWRYGMAWAFVAGEEGGVYRTIDGGLSWQGVSLLAGADISGIADLAAGSQSGVGVLYMLSQDGGDTALWRYDSAWERVFTSSQYGGSADMVEVDGGMVLLADADGGGMWFSEDGGRVFSPLKEVPSAGISSLVIVNKWNWWVGDKAGCIWATADRGNSAWSRHEVDPAETEIASIDYQAGVAIAGGSGGEAFISDDGGLTWGLAGGGPVYEGDAPVYVCSGSRDGIFYAASGDRVARLAERGGVYGEWEFYDTDLEGGGAADVGEATGVVCGNGVLYIGGDSMVVPRCVNPAVDIYDIDDSNWDQTLITPIHANEGGDYGIKGLALAPLEGANTVWAYDGDDALLWDYTDMMIGPPVGGTPHLDSDEFVLSWEGFASAEDWEARVYSDEYMTALSECYHGLVGGDDPILLVDEKSATGRIPTTSTQYWWQVRAVKPVHSRWSEVWSFYLEPQGLNIGSGTIAPPLGATGVPRLPSFAWRNVEGADSYYFELSDRADFAYAIESAEVVIPAYQATTELISGSNYFFRVRAISSGVEGDWTYGVFTVASPSVVNMPLGTVIEARYFYALVGVGSTLAVVMTIFVFRPRMRGKDKA